MELFGFRRTDFHEIYYFNIFRKSAEKIQVLFKYEKNDQNFTWRPMTISRPVPVTMRNVSDKICSENQNTHFVFNSHFFSENHAVYEIMWKKYCTARQATGDNMPHASYMLDN